MLPESYDPRLDDEHIDDYVDEYMRRNVARVSGHIGCRVRPRNDIFVQATRLSTTRGSVEIGAATYSVQLPHKPETFSGPETVYIPVFIEHFDLEDMVLAVRLPGGETDVVDAWDLVTSVG